LWVNYGLLVRIQLTKSNADPDPIHDPIYREAVSVIGVGYDSVDKRVYWTDVKLGKETIESVTTDGHNRRVVLSTGLGMPEDLVVDETSRNIYFRSAAI